MKHERFSTEGVQFKIPNNSAELREALLEVTLQSFALTRQLASNIQNLLKSVYSIQEYKLSDASDFIWPLKSSIAAEKAIPYMGGGVVSTKAFYINDRDPTYDYMFEENILGHLRERFKPKRLLFVRGLLPFEHLNPIIFFLPSFIKGINTSSPEVMIQNGQIHNLEIIAEEVGHFLNAQLQYNLHRELGGTIMPESLALLDWYLITSQLIKSLHLNPDNKIVEDIKSNVAKKLSMRENVILDPYTSGYRKSIWIIWGFINHLEDKMTKGEDIFREVGQFYRLSGTDKLFYLGKIYNQYVQSGNTDYQYDLDAVKSALTYEEEFGRVLFDEVDYQW